MYMLYSFIKEFFMTQKYHHGQLKQALIEAGIEILNVTTPEQLSLRKVANQCGVSHAAPYKHFKNKQFYKFQMSHINK